MAQIIVEAAPRSDRGKNEARRLRKSGQVPAVLYGGKGESLTLSVNAKQVGGILRSETGHNTLFQVSVGGKQQPAIFKAWQVDPVSGNLLHVDLIRVAMDVRMRVKVPVHTFGEPAGVKQQGGIFETVTREVEIECLPTEIPAEFRMDVSELLIGKHLRAGELPIDPAKRVSPASSSCCCGNRRQMLPGVCPGVWITSPGRVERPTVSPSSALASGDPTSGVGTPSQPACISIAPSKPRSF